MSPPFAEHLVRLLLHFGSDSVTCELIRRTKTKLWPHLTSPSPRKTATSSTSASPPLDDLIIQAIGAFLVSIATVCFQDLNKFPFRANSSNNNNLTPLFDSTSPDTIIHLSPFVVISLTSMNFPRTSKVLKITEAYANFSRDGDGVGGGVSDSDSRLLLDPLSPLHLILALGFVISKTGAFQHFQKQVWERNTNFCTLPPYAQDTGSFFEESLKRSDFTPPPTSPKIGGEQNRLAYFKFYTRRLLTQHKRLVKATNTITALECCRLRQHLTNAAQNNSKTIFESFLCDNPELLQSHLKILTEANRLLTVFMDVWGPAEEVLWKWLRACSEIVKADEAARFIETMDLKAHTTTSTIHNSGPIKIVRVVQERLNRETVTRESIQSFCENQFLSSEGASVNEFEFDDGKFKILQDFGRLLESIVNEGGSTIELNEKNDASRPGLGPESGPGPVKKGLSMPLALLSSPSSFSGQQDNKKEVLNAIFSIEARRHIEERQVWVANSKTNKKNYKSVVTESEQVAILQKHGILREKRREVLGRVLEFAQATIPFEVLFEA